jgi:hypothetical protein
MAIALPAAVCSPGYMYCRIARLWFSTKEKPRFPNKTTQGKNGGKYKNEHEDIHDDEVCGL